MASLFLSTPSKFRGLQYTRRRVVVSTRGGGPRVTPRRCQEASEKREGQARGLSSVEVSPAKRSCERELGRSAERIAGLMLAQQRYAARQPRYFTLLIRGFVTRGCCPQRRGVTFERDRCFFLKRSLDGSSLRGRFHPQGTAEIFACLDKHRKTIHCFANHDQHGGLKESRSRVSFCPLSYSLPFFLPSFLPSFRRPPAHRNRTVSRSRAGVVIQVQDVRGERARVQVLRRRLQVPRVRSRKEQVYGGRDGRRLIRLLYFYWPAALGDWRASRIFCDPAASRTAHILSLIHI